MDFLVLLVFTTGLDFWNRYLNGFCGILFQVKEAYISFLNHCYIDTEVEMKEIYTTNYMWSLFERSFLIDMNHITSNAYLMSRTDADVALEAYVTNSVMTIINTFFNSPFSDQSSSLLVSVSTVLHMTYLFFTKNIFLKLYSSMFYNPTQIDPTKSHFVS